MLPSLGAKKPADRRANTTSAARRNQRRRGYDQRMNKSDASQGQSAAALISKRIADLGDWRGETLARMRKLIKEADPDVVEEWKSSLEGNVRRAIDIHEGVEVDATAFKALVREAVAFNNKQAT